MSLVSKKKKKISQSTDSETTEKQDGEKWIEIVTKKLEKHEEYETKSPEERRQKAQELTDVEQLHAFDHLTYEYFEGKIRAIIEEAEMPPTHPFEELEAKDRIARVVGRVLPVKLYLQGLQNKNKSIPRILTPFSKLIAQYGLNHAAIQVGDVVIDWDKTSLAIPEVYELNEPEIATDISHQTMLDSVVSEVKSMLEESVESLHFDKLIQLLLDDLLTGILAMIHKIKEVIVKYNRHCRYDLFMRNCQTFVNDVLEAIGAKNAPKELTGKLNEYFKHLTENKKFKSEFRTHEELDQHVSGLDLADVTQHDKEYLLYLYVAFHKNEECPIPGCCMERIDEDLATHPMILERFLQYNN